MTIAHVNSPLILFVDDEESAVKYFQRAIGALAPVVTAGSVAGGKRMLDEYASSLVVVVSDQRMPGGYGNELLHYAREQYPHMVRILTTAYSELKETIDAVNQGQIHRYIQKPWDITLLRMELKQSLELANLRKEHSSLLLEKLEVRQKQIVSNRIGSLYTLCISLLGTGHSVPLETYLSVAQKVGATAPALNWTQMDYFDLVTAEAVRSGEFNHAVSLKLAALRQQYAAVQFDAALDVLFEVLPGKLQPSSGGPTSGGPVPGSSILIDEANLAEYLEGPIETVVSSPHVNWLACLFWLDGMGWSLQITRSVLGLQCQVIKATPPDAVIKLAAWIEQF
jgi:two-component system probable response regulator PhcQ